MWPQSDIAMVIGTIAALAAFASFLHNPFCVNRYRMVNDHEKGVVLWVGSHGLYLIYIIHNVIDKNFYSANVLC